MTYRVVFDNNDFVNGGISPSKIDGGGAVLNTTTFNATQNFNGQIVNNKNLLVPFKTITSNNGILYATNWNTFYMTESEDYVLRVDDSSSTEAICLVNKSIGDIVYIKNDGLKLNLGVMGSFPGGGTINGTSNQIPSYYINTIDTAPNYATFLCVATNTWVTI